MFLYGFRCSILIFVHVWCTLAGDYTIRITLEQGSLTTGAIEVYHGATWGVVCNNDFDMVDATVACKQLGYSDANSFKTAADVGRTDYHIDGLQCVDTDQKLQGCKHNGFGGVISCSSGQNVAVECSGGLRQMVQSLYSRANHYWNCDEFASGGSYDFKNNMNVVVHGTPTFRLSPFNSGFRMEGLSNWIDLGNFKNQPCLVDPSNCKITVSFWMRYHHWRTQAIYLFGNGWSGSHVRGFTVWSGHGSRFYGYVSGSQRYCSFENYNAIFDYWFHFILVWDKNVLKLYRNGYSQGKVTCGAANKDPYIVNHQYRLGVHSDHADGSQYLFDTSFDEVAIWFNQDLSYDERKSFYNLAKDIGGFSLNKITIKVPGMSWQASYADTSSAEHTQLQTTIENELTEIYSQSSSDFYTSVQSTFEDSGGVLEITLHLTYSYLSCWNGYYLYKSFTDDTFLDQNVEVVGCYSAHEFCESAEIYHLNNNHHTGQYIQVWFYPVSAYFENPLFQGYAILTHQVNGSHFVYATSIPDHLAATEDQWVKLYPDTTYSFTMVAYSIKGNGFVFGNTMVEKSLEGAPSHGPSYINTYDVTTSEAKVEWGEITSGQNGIIQRYRILLHGPSGNVDNATYLNVDEPRQLEYDGLITGQHYRISICGYTTNTKCGSERHHYFQTVAMLPSEPVRDVTIDKVWKHNISMSWHRVPVWSENGDMRRHVATFTNQRTNLVEVSASHSITEKWQVAYSASQQNLKGLTPYMVELKMVNQVGNSPSVMATFTTNESVPSVAPDVSFTYTPTTLYLEWPAIDREDTHGILLGYRLYIREVGTANWTITDTTELKLDIPVLSMRTYEFNMAAFTAVGEGPASPLIDVKIPGDIPVNFSKNIQFLARRNDSFDLQWFFETPAMRPVQFFVVNATRHDTNITEVLRVFPVSDSFALIYQYTLTGLKEYKWYNVHIAAGNEAGVGPFATALNQTAEGIPSASPRNLTAWNESSTSMFLQWFPVAYEYADGVIRGYRVYWHPVQNNGRRKRSIYDDWQSLQVNGGNHTFVLIGNLRKYFDYAFTISAFTSLGEGGRSRHVIARTDEDVPGHPPLNLLGTNTSSRSLQVNWEPVPREWQFGIVRGYHVTIMDTRNRDTRDDSVPVSDTSHEFTGLERYTNYSVQVAAFTVKGNGNYTEAIIVITDEDVPSEGPRNIIFSNKTSTSLTITWDVLPVPKAHGIVRSYHVFLYRVDGREAIRDNIQPYDNREATFTGLDEYVEYSTKITAATIKGDGNKSEPVSTLTEQDVPHAPPQNLQGYNTSDTSLDVFWEAVPSDDQNGIIIGYKLYYSTILRDGSFINHTKDVGIVWSTDLINLLPFKDYDVRIAARTSIGLGLPGFPTTIKTEEESPKLAPGNVQTFNTSSTSMRLTWHLIPPERVGGILRGYDIQWQEVNYDGQVFMSNQTRLNNISITSLDFHHLTKYQQYRFRIRAFTKFNGVFSANVSNLTDEDLPVSPPSNCGAFNVSKNDIQVNWDIVVPRNDRNGIIIGYEVYLDEAPDFVAPEVPTFVAATAPQTRSIVIGNLRPYFDYNIEVAAFTSKGLGPRCNGIIVRTEEEGPTIAPTNLTIFNTSSISLQISWHGLNVSLLNGIFRGYVVYYRALPQYPEAYLTYSHVGARRRRRAAFTLETQTASAAVGIQSIEVIDLAKYTNYNVCVAGATKFVGRCSFNKIMITDEDKPGKTPQNFHGYNLTSTSLQLKWSPVPNGFVHGILRGYRLYYRITKLPTMPLINITYDIATLSSVISDLLMFTNYTLQITAFTSKGEGPLTEPIVVSTDEDTATKSPMEFKVTTLFRTHEIPMTWKPVPNGFLNGILVGYRIKMRQISEGLEDMDGPEILVDVDSKTLSYTARNLHNFGTFTFQVIALTKYGEGVHSHVITAKTCPCEKRLSTNWFPLPPYTNMTKNEVTGIFPWLLDNLVEDCCRNCYNGHGWSHILFNTDGKGQEGFKPTYSDYSLNIDDDTDFHFPVQGHSLQEKYRSFYAYVYALGSPGVVFFIVDDPPDTMPNAVMTTIESSWSFIVLSIVFSMLAGIVLWFLDTGANEEEFPHRFFQGASAGFWWAFISMTTVGYGDKSPRSIPARLFAIFWVLAGLVTCSLLMSSLTYALTTISFEVKNIQLYGTKVAAIDQSPSYRVGIRRNAKVNQDNTYNDAQGIKLDLVNRKVKGALMDGYMAGSYRELFEDPHIRIHDIIDYNTGYGIAMGGDSKRLRKCFKQYVKRKRSYIVDYIASQVQGIRKNPVEAATERSSNLFSPEAEIFKKSLLYTLCLFGAAIVMGLCLHVHIRRKRKLKVDDTAKSDMKQNARELNEHIESFRARVTLLKQELRSKHINEHRLLVGLKRLPVQYDLLSEFPFSEIPTQEQINCHLLNSHNSSRLLLSPCDTSTLDGEIGGADISLNLSSGTGTTGTIRDDVQIPGTSQDNIITPCVDGQPNIRDLQRDAYLYGLRKNGEDSSEHPYSRFYRLLWVEKH